MPVKQGELAKSSKFHRIEVSSSSSPRLTRRAVAAVLLAASTSSGTIVAAGPGDADGVAANVGTFALPCSPRKLGTRIWQFAERGCSYVPRRSLVRAAFRAAAFLP
jgi:hypothetical protein